MSPRQEQEEGQWNRERNRRVRQRERDRSDFLFYFFFLEKRSQRLANRLLEQEVTDCASLVWRTRVNRPIDATRMQTFNGPEVDPRLWKTVAGNETSRCFSNYDREDIHWASFTILMHSAPRMPCSGFNVSAAEISMFRRVRNRSEEPIFASKLGKILCDRV